jgi:hypothetical protein
MFIPDSVSLQRSGIGGVVDPILLAELDREDERVRIYPIMPFWDRDGYLEPKYAQIVCLDLPADGIDVENTWDFSTLAESFPRGFVQIYQFGLGLKKPYLPILHAVEEHSKCTVMYLVDRDEEARISGDRFVLSLRRYEALCAELYRISSRAQAAARRVRHAVARNALSAGLGIAKVEPGRGRHPLSQAITDSLTGAVQLSVDQGSQLVSAAVAQSVELERNRPGTVAKLRNDLDLVSLDSLIAQFESAIKKRKPEPFWQRFFQNNPFALHLAFGYPLIEVQGQASVGGRKFAGGGEKVADFLVRTAATNNVGIFEIKKPGSDLMSSRQYRKGVYGPAHELAVAITQILDQRYHLANSFLERKNASRLPELESYVIRCCVIIGTTPQDLDVLKSFELFRGNSRAVDVVTFDELLTKLRQLRELLASGGERPES